tara:strand:+ start:6790 stop:7527 length:738 start_codon:yes stop_codon:yes gene_type:complete
VGIVKHEVIDLFPVPFQFNTIDKKSIKKLEKAITKEYKNNCDDPDTHYKADHKVLDLNVLLGFCKNSGVSSYQSTPNLQTKEEFAFFNDIIFEACRNWEEHTKINVETYDISLMWSNIYRPNGTNPEHFHPNSFLSGVVCIRDPSVRPHNGVTTNLGGTTFFNPLNQNFVIAPSVSERGSPYYTPSVKPELKENMMVIFPSWLRHAATPYFPQQENKDEFRVTLSFNVMIRGAAGSPDQLTHHIY